MLSQSLSFSFWFRAISHNHRHSERENLSVANQQVVACNQSPVISYKRSFFLFRSESRSARAFMKDALETDACYKDTCRSGFNITL
jgi:hypothetical protein